MTEEEAGRVVWTPANGDGLSGYLTQVEAGRYLRVSRATLTRLRDEGELPFITRGGRVYIAKVELDDYTRRQHERSKRDAAERLRKKRRSRAA